MTQGAILEICALTGLPMVEPGDDLCTLIGDALDRAGKVPCDHDVLVVAQKIVSKAEDRFVDLATVAPSTRALSVAAKIGKDPRFVEVVLSESRRIVRQRTNVLIVEHVLNFVMANAGIDRSNVGPDDGERVLLLPRDPDGSAAALCAGFKNRFECDIAVIINDSGGRAWRRGTVGVALGASGLPAVLDLRGGSDLFGRRLQTSIVGFADEIAAAASLVMGEADEATPVALVRGLRWSQPPSTARELIRPMEEDLFR
jgi:coenzyme F420-0:L-glutamate ligase/coenzyme F420-1:gamma-L-glutamate ligase